MNKTYDDLLQEVQTPRGQLEESERRGDELAAFAFALDRAAMRASAIERGES